MNTAVVTGAGRGLGRHIAEGLVAKGFRVLITDIDGEAAEAAATAIGEGAWAMRQDVRDPASHREAARVAGARGPLKVWVNNAGVLHTGVAWKLDDETVRRQVEVNVLGVMWGSRAAIDAMGSKGGQIINIASLSSHLPAPGLAVYGATKHAVLGFSTSLEGDLKHAGLPIHVSVVCPDAIDTDMVRNVAHTEEASLLFSAHKLLAPEVVARVVVGLVEKPRLIVTMPPVRAALAQIMRGFPSIGLKVLQPFRRVGERHRLEAIRKG